MDTIGIIAEYNPFHNGHLYQIRKIKELTKAANIIIVMSGDFVQRGTPAWTDKYLRTEMALSQGASMVFELPTVFATSSAETFARGGISLLSSLGFVQGICFGSECDNLALLQEIAAFLANPSTSYEAAIRSLTAEGFSYPAARCQALKGIFETPCAKYPNLFSDPNNILAIEYLKAVLQLNSPLMPILIARKGLCYHSNSLQGSLVSATAIRSAAKSPDFINQIINAVPAKVHSLLKTNHDRYPITADDFSSLLYYRLTNMTERDKNIPDMTEEIRNRIQNMLPSFKSFSDFTAKIKTKQYTYSRISRVLLRLLLNIPAIPTFCTPPRHPYVPYARLLGFRREKSFLLRQKTAVPIITKPADGIKHIQNFYHALPEDIKNLYETDIFCSNLYRQVQNACLNLNLINEYCSHPVIW